MLGSAPLTNWPELLGIVVIFVNILKWFLTLSSQHSSSLPGMSLFPRDMWQCWGHFWLTQLEGVLLASSGQRMLVNIVRCTGRLIICDEVEKPCCGLLVPATVSVISLNSISPHVQLGISNPLWAGKLVNQAC